MSDFYMVGTRIRVSEYYRDCSVDGAPVMALPGETGVVTEVTIDGPVVVFDRTGYRTTVSPSHVMDAPEQANGW